MILDAHCDVLYKMWKDQSLSFANSKSLHITMEALKKGNVKVQLFAIYVPPTVSQENKFNVALHMIDIFYKKIMPNHPQLKLVRTKEEISRLKKGEIGIMLALEGCDCIGDDPVKLRTLFRLGVRSVGLTWNFANTIADGALENRNAGLSNFGVEIVQQINEAKCWTDVSHLSEKSFWDTIEIASYPIASHSNVKAICDHKRNLTNEQIHALVKKGGVIGLTFVPMFLTFGRKATIKDILNHLDYICSLGAEQNVGFGSDFDGIEKTVIGLENVSKYEAFANILLKHYNEDLVKGFLFENFYRTLPS